MIHPSRFTATKKPTKILGEEKLIEITLDFLFVVMKFSSFQFEK
jgi:hypothetical protein